MGRERILVMMDLRAEAADEDGVVRGSTWAGGRSIYNSVSAIVHCIHEACSRDAPNLLLGSCLCRFRAFPAGSYSPTRDSAASVDVVRKEDVSSCAVSWLLASDEDDEDEA